MVILVLVPVYRSVGDIRSTLFHIPLVVPRYVVVWESMKYIHITKEPIWVPTGMHKTLEWYPYYVGARFEKSSRTRRKSTRIDTCRYLDDFGSKRDRFGLKWKPWAPDHHLSDDPNFHTRLEQFEELSMNQDLGARFEKKLSGTGSTLRCWNRHSTPHLYSSMGDLHLAHY